MLPIHAEEFRTERKRPLHLVPLVVLALILGSLILFGPSKEMKSFGYVFLVGLTYFLMMFDLRTGLTVLIIGIGISPDINVGGVQLRISDFLIPIFLFIFLAKQMAEKTEFRPTMIGRPFMLLMSLSLISTLLAAMTIESFNLTTGIFHTLKIVEYFLIFFLVLNILKSMSEVRFFITSMFVASSLLIAFLYYQLSYVVRRVSGPEGETANILGGYLLFHFLLALGVTAMTDSRRIRILGSGFLLITIYPFIRTLSRTSYVALFVTLTFIALISGRKSLIFVLILSPLVLWIAGDRQIIDRVSTFVNLSEDSSFQSRMYAIKSFSLNVVDSPLLGTGKGIVNLGDVDNEYVKLALETGLMGLVVFFFFLYRIGKVSFDTLNLVRDKDKTVYGFCVGFIAGLGGLMIHALGATSFTTIRTMEPFYFALGIVVATYHVCQRENIASSLPKVVTPKDLGYHSFQPKPRRTTRIFARE
ncbi:MAG: O-antigen ligase family protein [Planctomycetes bacterium]|nr:O-antigen ligase family protein [Planctomycetota bacterium]